jgi:hypothetical protein
MSLDVVWRLRRGIPGMSYRRKIGMPLLTMASYFL